MDRSSTRVASRKALAVIIEKIEALSCGWKADWATPKLQRTLHPDRGSCDALGEDETRSFELFRKVLTDVHIEHVARKALSLRLRDAAACSIRSASVGTGVGCRGSVAGRMIV